MNIGINGYEAVVSRFGVDLATGLPKRAGSGEYCYQLICELYKYRKKHNFSIFLPTEKTSDMPKEDANWKYIIVKNTKLWTLLSLTRHFLTKKYDLDVFFSPTHYAPLFHPGKLAISIMDLSYLYFPQLFKKIDLWQLKLWTYLSAKKASRIICISNSTKNDIINEYHLPKNSVKVSYPGLKSSMSMKVKVSNNNQNLKSHRYILFVGTLQPRKNIEFLIESFSNIKDKSIDLLIVGKPGWQYESILEAPKRYSVEDRVKFISNADDAQLNDYYQNATLFVLPSLYEGFGLPILEAMSFGVPVLASNVSSMPEVGGEAALYFDPKNILELTNLIDRVLNDEFLRKELSEKGEKQAKKFTWEKCAEDTIKYLEEIS